MSPFFCLFFFPPTAVSVVQNNLCLLFDSVRHGPLTSRDGFGGRWGLAARPPPPRPSLSDHVSMGKTQSQFSFFGLCEFCSLLGQQRTVITCPFSSKSGFSWNQKWTLFLLDSIFLENIAQSSYALQQLVKYFSGESLYGPLCLMRSPSTRSQRGLVLPAGGWWGGTVLGSSRHLSHWGLPEHRKENVPSL